MSKATEGLEVIVTPSKHTREGKFKKSPHKKTYHAKITEVNENSVDLTVYGNGEMVFLKKIPHLSVAETGKTSWDLKPQQ